MPTKAEEAATTAITAIDAAFNAHSVESKAQFRRNERYFAAQAEAIQKANHGFLTRFFQSKAKPEKGEEPVFIPLAEVIFDHMPALQSLSLSFAKPQHLLLAIQSASGSWEMQYEYPAWGLAMHVVRVVAANLAFIVNGALIDPIKTELEYIDDLIEHPPLDAMGRYFHTPPYIKEEAARRGIECVSPYGFQTTIDMQTASGQTCCVFFQTNNTNNKTKPYFVRIENHGPPISGF